MDRRSSVTVTLEKELEQLITDADYRIGLRSSGGLHVDVIYVPAFQARDIGGRVPVVMNSGVIGHGYFTGWGKWRRARRFIKRTVEGHRKVLAVGVVQVR
jgi:hypothetical protein